MSTCNRIRTDLVFCDLRCFDAHIPVMNHRDAGAFEKTAPRSGVESTPKQESNPAPRLNEAPDHLSDDVLVVVSKVKHYIREKSGMNTSDAVMNTLSDHIRDIALKAITKARGQHRKTVMEQDLY